MNIISGISSILAIGLLTPVQSILCLIILFVSTAISLYNNDFVLMGILYVLIYVGAIAILFLFILSLLKIEYLPSGKVSPLIITIIIVTLLPLDLLYDNEITNNIIDMSKGYNLNEISNELIIVGNQLYTEYGILMIITGIILILSIVGAISITK